MTANMTRVDDVIKVRIFRFPYQTANIRSACNIQRIRYVFYVRILGIANQSPGIFLTLAVNRYACRAGNQVEMSNLRAIGHAK